MPRNGFYSHPGKRSNPERHGSVERFDKGCRCWRCMSAVLKDQKFRTQAADALYPRSLRPEDAQ